MGVQDVADRARTLLESSTRATVQPDKAEPFLAAVADGVRLVPLGAEDAETDGEPVVGRLGGPPLLPSAGEWPRYGTAGPYLPHVATLDCAALHPFLPAQLIDAGFPDSGLLSFFYADELMVLHVLDDEADGGAQVRWYPDPAALQTVATPDGTRVYDGVDLTAARVPTWPSMEHHRLAGVARMWPDPGTDAFDDVLWEARMALPGANDHQVGGFSTPRQDAPESQLAFQHAERDGRPSELDDPDLLADADSFLLLAQLDSEWDLDLRWGDSGTLYWLIRAEDLAARRFDRVGLVWAGA